MPYEYPPEESEVSYAGWESWTRQERASVIAFVGVFWLLLIAIPFPLFFFPKLTGSIIGVAIVYFMVKAVIKELVRHRPLSLRKMHDAVFDAADAALGVLRVVLYASFVLPFGWLVLAGVAALSLFF